MGVEEMYFKVQRSYIENPQSIFSMEKNLNISL